MPRATLLTVLILTASSAHAGYACVDPTDPDARRWFQDDPCVTPMVHRPLPVPPLIIEWPAPRTDWLPGTPAGEGSTVYRWHRHWEHVVAVRHVGGRRTR